MSLCHQVRSYDKRMKEKKCLRVSDKSYWVVKEKNPRSYTIRIFMMLLLSL